MDPAKVKEIASAGGKAVAASGHQRRFTPAEAREAGRKGGLAKRTLPKVRIVPPEELTSETLLASDYINVSNPGVAPCGPLVEISTRIERNEAGMPIRFYPETSPTKA